MSSDQGLFENDDDYRHRVAQESNERTIEELTGSTSKPGLFEGDDDYRLRIEREANEATIDSISGSAPKPGLFEGDDDYRQRIEREANEATIQNISGSAPKPGLFEGQDDYSTRIRKEANERRIEIATNAAPKQGLFEGDHDYRSRIAHEAREVTALERTGSADSGQHSSSGGSDQFRQGTSSEVRHSRARAEVDALPLVNGWSAAIVLLLVCILAPIAYLHNEHDTAAEEAIANADGTATVAAVVPESPALSSVFVSSKDLVNDPLRVRVMIDSVCYSDTVVWSSASGKRISGCRSSRILRQMGATRAAQLISAELDRSVWGEGDWVPARLVSHGAVSELFVADLMSNVGEASWLVNGKPSFVRIDVSVEEAIAASAIRHDWRNVMESLRQTGRPTTWLNAPVFLRNEQNTAGDQRLIFSKTMVDGCHACPVLGRVEFGFDVTKDGAVVRKVVTNVLGVPLGSPH
jgi:hypothetical protein